MEFNNHIPSPSCAFVKYQTTTLSSYKKKHLKTKPDYWLLLLKQDGSFGQFLAPPCTLRANHCSRLGIL